jgi:hypothetical protein
MSRHRLISPEVPRPQGGAHTSALARDGFDRRSASIAGQFPNPTLAEPLRVAATPGRLVRLFITSNVEIDRDKAL